MSTKTALWFDSQPQLNSHVAALLKKEYPREDFEEILSEVNFWFTVWSDRGTCDEFIDKDSPPSVSILKIWVAQKLNHRRYRDGKDALQRELRGTRTQSEIRKRAEGVENFIHPQTLLSDPNSPTVVEERDEEGQGSYHFVEPAQSPLQLLEEHEKIAFVQDLIRVKRARAAERYARFCDHLLRGRTKEETALLEGVSELRVTHIYQRVRNDLKDAPLMIAMSLKLLAALADEPWSTTDELDDAIGGDVKSALSFLVIRGLVTKKSGNSFAPTNAGLRAIASGTLI